MLIRDARLPDMEVAQGLASALRAGDDSAAARLGSRTGVSPWLLTHRGFGPRGRLDTGVVAEVLGCVWALAAGRSVTLAPWLAKPAVIDLVAEAVETAAVPGRVDEHPWARGIAALEDRGHPAVPMLLRARAAEGSGRCDEARQMIESCLRLDPTLLPAARDAMEYELCAGNWARAWRRRSAPLTEPVDMYEVTSVKHGSDLNLRSLVAGPQRVWQRDRMFSLSVRRLDIVIGRLLPDGAQLPGDGRYMRVLGGMGILPRDFREAGEALFP